MLASPLRPHAQRLRHGSCVQKSGSVEEELAAQAWNNLKVDEKGLPMIVRSFTSGQRRRWLGSVDTTQVATSTGRAAGSPSPTESGAWRSAMLGDGGVAVAAGRARGRARTIDDLVCPRKHLNDQKCLPVGFLPPFS